MIFYVPKPDDQSNTYSEQVKRAVSLAEKESLKLTGRGKITFWCPSCNRTRPQHGRKHIHDRAVCSECVNNQEKK